MCIHCFSSNHIHNCRKSIVIVNLIILLRNIYDPISTKNLKYVTEKKINIYIFNDFNIDTIMVKLSYKTIKHASSRKKKMLPILFYYRKVIRKTYDIFYCSELRRNIHGQYFMRNTTQT